MTNIVSYIKQPYPFGLLYHIQKTFVHSPCTSIVYISGESIIYNLDKLIYYNPGVDSWTMSA